jgi:NADH:ubiquinone oxidoreductase subunit F (NADH-binding)/(2Fe-2S) ferredoxin
VIIRSESYLDAIKANVEAEEGRYKYKVLVCMGAGCISSGSEPVRDALVEEIERLGMSGRVKVVGTGCIGCCGSGPVVLVQPDGVLYQGLKPEDARGIVEEHILNGVFIERLLHRSPESGNVIPLMRDIPFFKHQTKNLLRICGNIDPTRIEEYIALEGYYALSKVLTSMTPEDVVEEIRSSRLRGRGGAGFPTGLKWNFTRIAKDEPKYVVANADEGDPGAFMDRCLLEGDPHSLIEGMTIAGYAVGAHKGYIYIRAEYPLAVSRLSQAMEQARKLGLLGGDIMESGFSFDIELRMGAGAFVCGEETALLASIEGRRGVPRPRPPFPAEKGVWGKPTALNNVETLANVPMIIRNGAECYRSLGTERSGGTKMYSLAGDIENTGLIEVPIGTEMGKIIYDIGEGCKGGKKFKAVQSGGPSGGCIPREHLNV